VPEAIERWLRFYECDRMEGEAFHGFSQRVGAGEFEARVKDLTMPIEFSLENMSYFIDFNREEPCVVQRGEGACAV
jgi:hypothetical protein